MHMYSGYDVLLNGNAIHVIWLEQCTEDVLVHYRAGGARFANNCFAQPNMNTPPEGITLKPKPGPRARQMRNTYKRQKVST